MEVLAELLPIIIYALLIVLLIVCIVIGYKFIITMNHIEKIVDDVDEKVQSFNKFFSVLNFTTDKIATVSDTLISGISGALITIFGRKKKKKRKVEVEDEEM